MGSLLLRTKKIILKLKSDLDVIDVKFDMAYYNVRVTTIVTIMNIGNLLPTLSAGWPHIAGHWHCGHRIKPPLT